MTVRYPDTFDLLERINDLRHGIFAIAPNGGDTDRWWELLSMTEGRRVVATGRTPLEAAENGYRMLLHCEPELMMQSVRGKDLTA